MTKFNWSAFNNETRKDNTYNFQKNPKGIMSKLTRKKIACLSFSTDGKF